MQDVPIQHPALWRAADVQRDAACRLQGRSGISSGFSLLDAALPDGGWPQDGVVELLGPEFGADANLLAPLLRALSAQSRWQVWINPPWLPYAPALQRQGIELGQVLLLNCGSDKDALWAMEQCLASGSCSIVQAWPSRLQSHQIRRLQLAAQKGAALGFLLRPQTCAQQSSPAPLRLELKTTQAALEVRVLKRRGGWGSDWMVLKTPPAPCSTASFAALPMGAALPGSPLPVTSGNGVIADPAPRIMHLHSQQTGFPGA